MKGKNIFILIAVCIFLIIFSVSLFAAEKPIIIKVGHGHTATHSYQLGLEQSKKFIEEKTNGRISVKFYPSAQLGNERQMQESLTAGTLEMTITGLVNLYDPAFALFDFPYLYTNREQIKAVMYSDLMDDMGKVLVKKGMRIIGLMEVGFRMITSNKPIKTPDDLKGFKIRTPESNAQIETFRAMGAKPTPMSFNELYGALQQGIVDGQENPLENIYNAKFYEVQKYVTASKHIYNFAYVLVSEKFWQTLSKEDQNLLTYAIREGCFWQINYLSKREAELEQELKDNGMEFIYPDLELFKKASLGAYESDFFKKLEPRSSEIIKQIRDIVARY
jgi:tripartite ATP-independent transporter DctP family solute receptor